MAVYKSITFDNRKKIAALYAKGMSSLCKYRSRKPEGVAVELADAVIRIADLCGHLEIDLEEVIEIKMAYNEGRPYKHGKKF